VEKHRRFRSVGSNDVVAISYTYGCLRSNTKILKKKFPEKRVTTSYSLEMQCCSKTSMFLHIYLVFWSVQC